jgi:hypothetical protein
MVYELPGIIVMLAIFIIGGRKMKRAETLLNDAQRAVSTQIFAASRKGITLICPILIGLLILGYFLVNSYWHVFSFVIFFLLFLLQIFYALRLKLLLSFSDLPNNYTTLVSKINVLFSAGIFIVVLALMVNLI